MKLAIAIIKNNIEVNTSILKHNKLTKSERELFKRTNQSLRKVLAKIEPVKCYNCGGVVDMVILDTMCPSCKC